MNSLPACPYCSFINKYGQLKCSGPNCPTWIKYGATDEQLAVAFIIPCIAVMLLYLHSIKFFAPEINLFLQLANSWSMIAMCIGMFAGAINWCRVLVKYLHQVTFYQKELRIYIR